MPGTKFHQITAKAVIRAFEIQPTEDEYHTGNDIDRLNQRVASLERLLGVVLNHLGPKFMFDTYVKEHGSDYHYNEHADGYGPDACLVRFVAEEVK